MTLQGDRAFSGGDDESSFFAFDYFSAQDDASASPLVWRSGETGEHAVRPMAPHAWSLRWLDGRGRELAPAEQVKSDA